MSTDQEYWDYMFKYHKNPSPYSLRVFGKVFLYYHNRFGWFRFLGKGLKWKDTSIHRLTFSERNGYHKGLMLGNWRISILN